MTRAAVRGHYGTTGSSGIVGPAEFTSDSVSVDWVVVVSVSVVVVGFWSMSIPLR
jgi:hypothetical protein